MSEGNKRQIRSLEIPAPRGEIFDRNGNLLALSTSVDDIWVDPKILSFYLDKKQQQAIYLAKKAELSKEDFIDWSRRWQENLDYNLNKYRQMLRILNIAEPALTTKILANKKRRFMYVQRGVLPRTSQKIIDISVAGLFINNKYKRYYPSGEVTSQIIGFTNIDDKGISGLEKTYNDWLAGSAGKKKVIRDRTGRVIEFVKDIEVARPGNSLTLSIDGNIQYLLYHALKKAYGKHLPVSAQSVILDARTGEILAMASVPSFNPNDRSQLSGGRLINRVVFDRMEMGSPIKPFIFAKALDKGVLSVDEIIDTSPGRINIHGNIIRDVRNFGKLDVTTMLQKSTNVGVIKVALRLTPQEQRQMLVDLGFGQSLGLFLPDETLGFIKPLALWQDIDQASSSYGYGFNANLMQLARAYTIFTNDGVVKPLSLLKIDPNLAHKKTDNERLQQPKQVISKEVAQQVLLMLETVTQKGGTATRASIDGFRVAGKTGTVHKAKAGGYYKDKFLSLFVGIVPVSNPRFIMATVVNEPTRGVYFGGLVAAPIFKSVMQDVLRLKNVPPDNITGSNL